MATTWGVVRERLRRMLTDVILQDSDGNDIEPAFSSQELADYWNAAQDELVVYVALEAINEIVAGATSVALPNDFYEVHWVRYDVTNGAYFLKELDPLAFEGDPHDPTWTGLYYLIRNESTILISDTTTYTITLGYGAYYAAVTSPDVDATVISVPRWAILPLLYFACLRAMERRIIEDANLRRFATRQLDAGQPTSNPFTPAARYYLDRFREAMDKHMVGR